MSKYSKNQGEFSHPHFICCCGKLLLGPPSLTCDFFLPQVPLDFKEKFNLKFLSFIE
jgi:hypothetical protein